MVPDATEMFEKVVETSLMVPMGDPNDAQCTWGLPTIFWGLSGIAKSDRIRQAAAAADLPCEVIMPGQRQPEDFSGVLVPNGNGSVSIECLLQAIRILNKHGRGVLFVDEVSCATPATQGSMLGMVNDRQVGDVKMAPGIRILLAANPPKYAAGGWALEAPFSNRMAHFQVRCPSTMEWSEHMMSTGVKREVDLTLSENKLKSAWGPAMSYTFGTFCGFMHSRQKLLHDQPLPGNPQASYCWPSPRTWTWSARTLTTIRALGLDPTLEQLFIDSLVGSGAGAEFYTWMKENDLPRPEQVLIKGWEPDRSRIDVTLAVVASTISYVTGLRDLNEKQEAAALMWNFVQKVIDAGLSDIALPAAQTLVKAKLSTKEHKNSALKKAASTPLTWLANHGLLIFVTGEGLDQ
jgi:hypothetical protein